MFPNLNILNMFLSIKFIFKKKLSIKKELLRYQVKKVIFIF